MRATRCEKTKALRALLAETKGEPKVEAVETPATDSLEATPAVEAVEQPPAPEASN